MSHDKSVGAHKSTELVVYRNPALSPEHVERYPWRVLFTDREMFLRALSAKEKELYETSCRYGIFNCHGEFKEAAKTRELADDWIEVEGCLSIWMH